MSTEDKIHLCVAILMASSASSVLFAVAWVLVTKVASS